MRRRRRQRHRSLTALSRASIPELLDAATQRVALFDATPSSLADAVARVVTDGIAHAVLASPPDRTRAAWLQFHSRLVDDARRIAVAPSPSLDRSALVVSIVTTLGDATRDADVVEHVRRTRRSSLSLASRCVPHTNALRR